MSGSLSERGQGDRIDKMGEVETVGDLFVVMARMQMMQEIVAERFGEEMLDRVQGQMFAGMSELQEQGNWSKKEVESFKAMGMLVSGILQGEDIEELMGEVEEAGLMEAELVVAENDQELPVVNYFLEISRRVLSQVSEDIAEGRLVLGESENVEQIPAEASQTIGGFEAGRYEEWKETGGRPSVEGELLVDQFLNEGFSPNEAEMLVDWVEKLPTEEVDGEPKGIHQGPDAVWVSRGQLGEILNYSAPDVSIRDFLKRQEGRGEMKNAKELYGMEGNKARQGYLTIEDTIYVLGKAKNARSGDKILWDKVFEELH